jgi:hypothetical protein
MEVLQLLPLQITASDSATNPLEVVPPGLGRVKSFVIDNEPRTRILYYCYFKYFIDFRYRIDTKRPSVVFSRDQKLHLLKI